MDGSCIRKPPDRKLRYPCHDVPPTIDHRRALTGLLLLLPSIAFGACARASFTADDYADRGAWVTVNGATFTMGSSPSAPCRFDNQEQHLVTLTHRFEIQSTEMTQGRYQDLMGSNPSFFTACGRDCPVEFVSWHDAAAACNALSTQYGYQACYQCEDSGGERTCTSKPAGADIYDCLGFRLPTDAEWELAYRAATTTLLYRGDVDQSECNTCSSVAPNVDAIGWYCANSAQKTHPVAEKRPNAWGLFDMAGNVWEWCHDGYRNELGTSPVTDPVIGPAGATYQLARGGSWINTANALYAAQRYSLEAGYRNNGVGFRCVRTLK